MRIVLIIISLGAGVLTSYLIYSVRKHKEIAHEITINLNDYRASLKQFDRVKSDSLTEISSRISKAVGEAGRSTLARSMAEQMKIGREYVEFRESLIKEVDTSAWAVTELRETVNELERVAFCVGTFFLLSLSLLVHDIFWDRRKMDVQ